MHDDVGHGEVGRLLYHFSAGRLEPYAGGAGNLTRGDRTSVFPVLVPGPGGRSVRLGEDVSQRDGTEAT